MRVVELLVSVGLGVVAVLAIGPDPALVPALAVAAVGPPLVRVDLAEHRLPNRMVVPALLAGVVGLALSWLVSGAAPLIPLLAGAIYAGVLFVLALFGGMGMGDVKLSAALGLASPTVATAVFSPLLAFLLGGVIAIIVLIRTGRGGRIAFGPFLLGGYVGVLAVWAVGRVLSPGMTG
jgi:leader peptidase (prepilin peptidase)/N-methyltransferase